MIPVYVRMGIPNRTSEQSAARPQRAAEATSHMTCPVNVSPSGGYPDGRTRRRGQEPAEPPQGPAGAGHRRPRVTVVLEQMPGR
jgi:hypothetical protein